MKRLLIAIDYGPGAQKLANAGAALAKAMGAEILLLHVLSDPAYYSTTAYSPILGFSGFTSLDYLQPDIMTAVRKTAEEFLGALKKALGPDNITILIKEGNAADCINETAIGQMADLVVLGSHSRNWLESMVAGSTVEKVLHNTLVPLYILPMKKTG